MLEMYELQQMQSLPLELKIRKTEIRIREWYNHYYGDVYVAFSGGKDSTVLLDIVRSQYPNVPAVFVDTGLEYPEIRDFVKSIDNVVWLKPEMNFKKVIETYGYPVISKRISRYINDLQNPTEKNVASRNLRLTGMNQKGEYCPSMVLSKKWRYLVEAPFKISDKCCDVMKKGPMKKYVKETGRVPLTGEIAAESRMRMQTYLRQGCNGYDLKSPKSTPMGFWLEQDVLHYLKDNNIPYSKIYGDIIEKNGELICTGEQRTGCMFCMFGVHMTKGENRFQRMKRTHPSQWKFCINQLGLGEILDYIKVDYGKDTFW
jgi:3'-phosphoadenosine 5'-phosphosulfate sulfotransferase (PAPS reductase)/FAD synthetase